MVLLGASHFQTHVAAVAIKAPGIELYAEREKSSVEIAHDFVAHFAVTLKPT
jgi:hypothetical protein